MKYPNFLNKDHNKLELIAPSFGCTTEPYISRLKKSIEHFKARNINVIEGKNIHSSIGYRSASSKDCADEFVDAYKNSDFIMSVGGGNFMYEILDDIDFNRIKELKPKWFMGYSDNTNLSFLLTTICDVASIYGYCAPEFGTDTLHQAQLDQLDLLFGKLRYKGYDKFELHSLKDEQNVFAPYNLDTKKELKFYNKENHIEGRLIGGCIDILEFILGTKYDNVDEFNEKYKDDGIIWFLESCDLESWNLKLILLQMKRAGWFKHVKGFIIGRPYMYDNESFGVNINDAAIDVLKEFNVPIILNADFGHLKPCFPIICGAYSKIDIIDENIEIEYILK